MYLYAQACVYVFMCVFIKKDMEKFKSKCCYEFTSRWYELFTYKKGQMQAQVPIPLPI